MAESTARTGWNDPDSAHHYDRRMVTAYGGPMARGQLRAVPPGAGPVLEVACGTGFFSERLLEALGPDGRVVGCDAGDAVLRVAAAKRLAGLSLVEADAHDLPLSDGLFSVAYCNLGMHIFLQPDRAVAEMARTLRPGGGLAYAIPGRGTLVEFWRAFRERAARPDLRGLIGPVGWAKIERWSGPDDAAEAAEHLPRLAAAGLRDARIDYEVERITFPHAADALERGGFGHFNQAVETIEDEALRAELRAGVLADVAALLDAAAGSGRVRLTVRALVVSGRK